MITGLRRRNQLIQGRQIAPLVWHPATPVSASLDARSGDWSPSAVKPDRLFAGGYEYYYPRIHQYYYSFSRS